MNETYLMPIIKVFISLVFKHCSHYHSFIPSLCQDLQYIFLNNLMRQKCHHAHYWLKIFQFFKKNFVEAPHTNSGAHSKCSKKVS